jgi:hypothetical protein
MQKKPIVNIPIAPCHLFPVDHFQCLVFGVGQW